VNESPSPPSADTGADFPVISISKVFPYLGASLCLALLGLGMVMPMLPLYSSGLGATGVWVGIILGSFSFSRMLLMPVFGWLSDRRGRKVLLATGLGACGVFSFAYLMGGNVASLVTVRLLHGGGAALIVPLVMAYVGDIVPRGEEGKWMGYLNTLMMVGMGAGPLLGGAVSDLGGPRMVFIVMGALYLVGFGTILAFLPESNRSAVIKSSGSSLRKMGTSRLFWGLMLFWLLMEGSFGIVFAFLPIDGAQRLDLTGFQIGVLIAVNTGFLSLMQIFTGKLADRLDRRWLIAAGSLLHYVSMGLIVVSGSFWQLCIIMAASGVGMALAVPAVSALTIEEGRRHGMGTANAWLSVGMSAGVATGPIIAGAVNDAAGLPAVFIMAGAIGLPSVATTLWLLRTQRTSSGSAQRT
jgi:MFS family permease